METPIVTTGVAKSEAQKPARDKPQTAAAGRAEARAGETTADRAALSLRSQAAAARARADTVPSVPANVGVGQAPAARARADHGTEAESDSARVRPGGFDPPPDGPAAADRLARETSRRILRQPAAAVRAQANSDGASVLEMLQ
jgi:hypothetical protein